MKVAVATKMPKCELAKKNNASGPRSSASLRSGLSWGFAAIRAVVCSATRSPAQSGIEPGRIQSNHGAGEVARRKRRKIVDAFANADEVHRNREFRRDGDEDAAARGAVEFGHDEPGDADGLLENIDLQ